MLKDYFQLPVDNTWVSYGYSSNHTAIDLGFFSERGPNEPVYPIGEGIVQEITWYGDGGNVIWIRHEDSKNTWYSGYMHLKSPATATVGSKVYRKSRIGTMGNTGVSKGPHVHLVLVKAPKGTKWNNRDTRKYRVNPLDYVYRFSHQKVKASYSGSTMIQDKPRTVYGVKDTPNTTSQRWSNTVTPLSLYLSPTDKKPAPGPSNAKRTYTVLDRKNKRIKIKHPLFNPNEVWVNESDGVTSGTSNKPQIAKPSGLNHVSETGYIFKPDRTINIRDYPDSKKGKVLGQWYKGESVKYIGYVINDGYIWIYYDFKGQRRYVATRETGAKRWGVFVKQ